MKVHWIGGEAEVDRLFRLLICTSSCRWIITIITNYEVMRTWERKVKKSYINCYVTGLNWFLCYIIVFHRCVPIPYIALSTWKRINWISENLDNSLDMPSWKGKKTIKFGHRSLVCPAPLLGVGIIRCIVCTMFCVLKNIVKNIDADGFSKTSPKHCIVKEKVWCFRWCF